MLGPIGTEMQRLVGDPAYLDEVLKSGAESARALSAPVLREVFDIVGFIQS